MDSREREKWQREQIADTVHSLIVDSSRLRLRFENYNHDAALLAELNDPRPTFRKMSDTNSRLQLLGASEELLLKALNIERLHLDLDDGSITLDIEKSEKITLAQHELSKHVRRELRIETENQKRTLTNRIKKLRTLLMIGGN